MDRYHPSDSPEWLELEGKWRETIYERREESLFYIVHLNDVHGQTRMILEYGVQRPHFHLIICPNQCI